MPVGLPDILSCDGNKIYMKSQAFDLEGNRLELGPHSGDPAGQGSVQGGETAHLFSPTGFLDDTWWHRTYWVYGRSFAGGHAGYHQAGKFAPSGRILVFDDSTVYGFGRKPQYYRWTTPLEYQLFAAPKQRETTSQIDHRSGGSPAGPKGQSMIAVQNTRSLNPTGKPLTISAWVAAETKNGVVVARGGPSQGYALVVTRGKPQFVIRSNEKVSLVEAAKRLPSDWTHLAGVSNADGTMAIYVDGQLSGEAADGGLIGGEPKQAMQIGADDGGAVGDYRSPSYFTGTIDEVRVYHQALTAEEISALASRESNAAAPSEGLVLSYSFDKGDATDASGEKNNGALGDVESVAGVQGKAMKFTGKGTVSSASGVRFLVEHDWTQDLPVLVRAMVLADDKLFVAGPPDLVDEEETATLFGSPEVQEKLAAQDAALRGARGADLWIVSTDDGTKLAELKLSSLPIFDGLAAAGDCLYMSTVDGRVICLSP
jgi:hypothetical protein